LLVAEQAGYFRAGLAQDQAQKAFLTDHAIIIPRTPMAHVAIGRLNISTSSSRADFLIIGTSVLLDCARRIIVRDEFLSKAVSLAID
jgi:hypothetical protein